MIPGTYFNNDELRKYTLLFGELFSNLRIERTNGTDTQYEVVPIAFGGREKWVARGEQDPDTMKSVAVQYPRMSYEFVGMGRDMSRQLNPVNRTTFETDAGVLSSRYVPAAWNFGFNLYITGRNVADASKLIQQIVPFFTPAYSVKAEIIENSCPYDLQIVLDNVQMDDNYQGPMTERRIMIWTLSFTLKGWMFGPAKPPEALIRWIKTTVGSKGPPDAPIYVSNTYPTVAGKTINQILPSDVYVLNVDLTDFSK